MDIRFNHTEPVNAVAETLFEVITDYAGYPRFIPAVVKMTVVAKHENGAEFIAERKTRIAKQVRAFDQYERHGDLVIKRTYGPESAAQSTWTIHPVDAGHSTLTIDASTTMPLLPGLVMKPLLRRLFYGINFSPFIQEAQRRTNATRSQTRWPSNLVMDAGASRPDATSAVSPQG
jgi:ribosome-associated toxin RatA of RatAB toxin-antitoxin module